MFVVFWERLFDQIQKKKTPSGILIEFDNDKRTYRSGWEWQMVGLWDSPEEVKTEVTHERSSKWTKRRNIEEKLASGSPDRERAETVTGFQAGRCMENCLECWGKEGMMEGCRVGWRERQRGGTSVAAGIWLFIVQMSSLLFCLDSLSALSLSPPLPL